MELIVGFNLLSYSHCTSLTIVLYRIASRFYVCMRSKFCESKQHLQIFRPQPLCFRLTFFRHPK